MHNQWIEIDDVVADLRKWAATICSLRNDEVPGSKVRLLTRAANELESLKKQRNDFRDCFNTADRILQRFENKYNEMDPGPNWDRPFRFTEVDNQELPPSATNPQTGIEYGNIE